MQPFPCMYVCIWINHTVALCWVGSIQHGMILIHTAIKMKYTERFPGDATVVMIIHVSCNSKAW